MCMQLGNNRDGARVKMYHGATFHLFFMHIGCPNNFKNYLNIFIVFQKSTKDNKKGHFQINFENNINFELFRHFAF